MFGDFCLGILDAVRLIPGGRRVYLISGTGVPRLSSFGEDQAGELYAMSLEGEVDKLVPVP